jgi:hypothetical protein
VIITRGGGEPVVATIDASTDGITRIMWMLNPEKIGAFLARAVAR